MIGGIQAFWGTHLLRVTEKQLQPIIDGLGLASELDYDELQTTEAQNPLNVRGGDRQKSFPVTFAVSRHTGGFDPVFEYQAWVRDLGKSMPFIVQYRPFGPKRLVLENVGMHDVDFGAGGEMIYAQISAVFTEDMPATTLAKEVTEATKNLSKGEKGAKIEETGLKFSAADLEEGKKMLGATS